VTSRRGAGDGLLSDGDGDGMVCGNCPRSAGDGELGGDGILDLTLGDGDPLP